MNNAGENMKTRFNRIGLQILIVALAYGGADIIYASGEERYDPPPLTFLPVEVMPHQVAVSDLICTGRVLSTNDGQSVEFAIDDLVWGTPPSTNITIRRVLSSPCPLETLRPGHKYLVFAFTNDWWGPGIKGQYIGLNRLADYITPTSRPPDMAVFDDYRIMNDEESVIDFELLDYDGTNYWPATRTFITNFNDITRMRHDRAAAKQLVDDTLTNRANWAAFPHVLHSKLGKYVMFYFDNEFIDILINHHGDNK